MNISVINGPADQRYPPMQSLRALCAIERVCEHRPGYVCPIVGHRG